MRTWILGNYRDYARGVLCAALFLGPLSFNKRTEDIFNLTKITVFWVLGLLAAWLWMTWSSERGVWVPRFKSANWSAVFLGACVLATAFSNAPAVSVLGFYKRYGGLVEYLLYATIMVVLVGLYWEEPEDLKAIPRLFTGASILLAAYVIVQATGNDWMPWLNEYGKRPTSPVGTMGNSNFAGGYLGISVPFVVFTAVSAKNPFWKSAIFLGVLVDLVAVWLTRSRGGLVAAGAGMVVMALAFRNHLPRWIRATAITTALLGATVFILASWHPGLKQPPKFIRPLAVFDSGSLQARTFYWEAAWKAFLDHPVVGTGLDTFYANYPRYRVPADGSRLGLALTDKPHNIYLEHASNSGILGIGSYLLLAGSALWYGYRNSQNTESQGGLLLACFLGVLAGYLAQGFFSIDVPPLALMGWVAVGGVATICDPSVLKARQALTSRLRASLPAQNKKGKRRVSLRGYQLVLRTKGLPVLVHAGTAGVLVLALFLGVRPWLADTEARAGRGSLRRDESFQKTNGHFEKAIKLHPFESRYRQMTGQVAISHARSAKDPKDKRRLFMRSIAEYKKALDIQPGDITVLIYKARAYSEWARLDAARYVDADRAWRNARSLDPNDWQLHERYAEFLVGWAEAPGGNTKARETAIKQLEIVTRMRPRELAPWINLSRNYLEVGRIEESRRAARRASLIDPRNEAVAKLTDSIPPPASG